MNIRKINIKYINVDIKLIKDYVIFFANILYIINK